MPLPRGLCGDEGDDGSYPTRELASAGVGCDLGAARLCDGWGSEAMITPVDEAARSVSRGDDAIDLGGKRRVMEMLVERALFAAGAASVLTTLAIVAVLLRESAAFFGNPQVRVIDFLTGTEWQPHIQLFGIWPLLSATFMVTAIAMAVALPLGLLAAIYLSEYASDRVRAVLKPLLEVLAGVPTVVNCSLGSLDPGGAIAVTLTVKAVTLAGDGVPANADTTDQDFALVVTNAVVYSGPILSAGNVTAGDVCAGAGSGGDSVIDPGESVVFSVPLANSGGSAATAVAGSLASLTPGATVLDGSSAYADIPAGGVGSPDAGDTLSVAVSETLPCGTGIELVLTVSTAQGIFAVPIHFEVGSRAVSTENLAGTTGPVNDDIASPSVFTTPSAVSGTIRSVSLDVNLASTDISYLFDNYSVVLTSPQGTGVTVHSNPIPCKSLNTTFPDNRLAQVGSMDLYGGQDAGGVWTLQVTDLNNTVCAYHGLTPCTLGTVNSWTVHITRESAPACNTCVAAAPPPEVSAPGSPSPFLLNRDTSTGTVTFAWEDLGTLADSYRLYQGTIGSLVIAGVTSSNTFPVQCGILGATTAFVPIDGDLFYLVAAQKGSLVGPLGEATDPVTYPRSADQTCP